MQKKSCRQSINKKLFPDSYFQEVVWRQLTHTVVGYVVGGRREWESLVIMAMQIGRGGGTNVNL